MWARTFANDRERLLRQYAPEVNDQGIDPNVAGPVFWWWLHHTACHVTPDTYRWWQRFVQTWARAFVCGTCRRRFVANVLPQWRPTGRAVDDSVWLHNAVNRHTHHPQYHATEAAFRARYAPSSYDQMHTVVRMMAQNVHTVHAGFDALERYLRLIDTSPCTEAARAYVAGVVVRNKSQRYLSIDNL